MNVTRSRWCPIILLRDARGRFLAVRRVQALGAVPVCRRRPRPVLQAVQLALF